jgi:ubiquinone/menaquinone biosynthesis C-methylase UbiE
MTCSWTPLSVLRGGAGTGDLGFIVAERVGADGKVLCTDFSPEMLEAARRNGERRGFSNVEYREKPGGRAHGPR